MNSISMLNKPVIKIDVVSDVVCPWCYIGKRRLEKAIDQLADQYTFDVTYHPFELNPSMPAQGANQQEYLINKFGGAERYQQITQYVSSVAATEGLEFNFDHQHTSPNTRDAHRIIELARKQGKQLEAKEAFLKAYFTDGVDLTKKENLIKVALSVGIDEQSVNDLLNSHDGLAEVELAEAEMQKLGVSGVPFYIINRQYGMSGAQPTATFKQALQEIGSKLELSGEACDVEGKNC